MFTIIRYLGPVLTVLESNDLKMLWDLWNVEDGDWMPWESNGGFTYSVKFGNGSRASVVIDISRITEAIREMDLPSGAGLNAMLEKMRADAADVYQAAEAVS